MKYINENNIFDYAFINIDALTLPVKAVCVDFHGYTDDRMLTESDAEARLFGEKGIAWVFPYYSVWKWMSRSSQEFNEQVHGKRKAVACAANCPVTDMGILFRDFTEARRAILSARILDDRPLETVLEE